MNALKHILISDPTFPGFTVKGLESPRDHFADLHSMEALSLATANGFPLGWGLKISSSGPYYSKAPLPDGSEFKSKKNALKHILISDPTFSGFTVKGLKRKLRAPIKGVKSKSRLSLTTTGRTETNQDAIICRKIISEFNNPSCLGEIYLTSVPVSKWVGCKVTCSQVKGKIGKVLGSEGAFHGIAVTSFGKDECRFPSGSLFVSELGSLVLGCGTEEVEAPASVHPTNTIAYHPLVTEEVEAPASVHPTNTIANHRLVKLNNNNNNNDNSSKHDFDDFDGFDSFAPTTTTNPPVVPSFHNFNFGCDGCEQLFRQQNYFVSEKDAILRCDGCLNFSRKSERANAMQSIF